jgi:hypothetical protein
VRTHSQFSLVPALPSIPSAMLPPGPRTLFGDFSGITAESDSSRLYARVVRHWPSPAGLFAPFRRLIANLEVSRFSCMEFLDVHGVSDYAGLTCRSR